jgi:hypothetical protein
MPLLLLLLLLLPLLTYRSQATRQGLAVPLGLLHMVWQPAQHPQWQHYWQQVGVGFWGCVLPVSPPACQCDATRIWFHDRHTLPNQHSVSVCACVFLPGATIVGKTHMSELAYSLDGNNAHYGTPLNLAAPGRNTGGSSSGSAVSLSASLQDLFCFSHTQSHHK